LAIFEAKVKFADFYQQSKMPPAKVPAMAKEKKQHLNQLSSLTSRPKRNTKLTRQSKLFKAIIKAILDKKGEDVISLDLRNIPEASADFFIICQAGNATQLKAIADHIDDVVKIETGENPYKREGYQHAKWILVDYVNVVAHVMHADTRKFYQLEEMWSDAGLLEHES
jgi:ribosome-associated protein